MARGRDVQGLLEVGAVERVGLVEERQHLELAAAQDALERHLGTGNELLDADAMSRGIADRTQLGSVEQRRNAAPGDGEGGWVIGANHAPTGGEQQRFEHARQRHAARQHLGIGVEIIAGAARSRYPRGGERVAQQLLVARALHRNHRVAPQAEALGGARGNGGGGLVGRDHRLKRARAGSAGDLGGRLLGVAKIERQRGAERLVGPDLGEHMAAVGAEDRSHPQAACRLDEGLGLIAGRRHQDEHPFCHPFGIARRRVNVGRGSAKNRGC